MKRALQQYNLPKALPWPGTDFQFAAGLDKEREVEAALALLGKRL